MLLRYAWLLVYMFCMCAAFEKCFGYSAVLLIVHIRDSGNLR